MKRRHGSDEGAALVLVLVVLLVLSLGIAAIVTFADTSIRTTVALRTQGNELYAANSSIDQAVTAIRGNSAYGVDGGACPTTNVTLNGVATSVTCRGLAGSGAGSSGSGVTGANSPATALLTLAPDTGNSSEDGLLSKSSNDLKISGPVVSNTNLTSNAGNIVVTGSTKARRECKNVTASPAVAQCNLGATITNNVDPGYTLRSDAGASPPALAALPAACVSGAAITLKTFSPGYYPSAAALNAVFSSCSGSVFWFQPGFYYFDFQDSGTTVWTISGTGSQLVGGAQTTGAMGWVAPATGSTRPTVPFPGGCVTSAASATAQGVQFAFGGTSRMVIDQARAELCASGSTSTQEIAVYGLKSGATPGQVGATYAAATATATISSGNPTFTTPNNAKVVDGGASPALATFTNTSSASKTNTLVMAGFNASVPSGSTIVSAAVRIRHRPKFGVATTGTSVTFAPGDSSGNQSYPASTTNGCSTSVTDLCVTASPTNFYDQSLSLPTSALTTTALTNATVTLAVTASKSSGTDGQEDVDGIELVVQYVAPAYRALIGCSSVSDPDCTLITTNANGASDETDLSIHGTLYAPTAKLDLTFKKASGSVVDRGVVIRSVEILTNPKGSFTGSAFKLPTAGPGGAANRTVEFVANQGSPLVSVLRAVIEFDDTVTPGATAQVTAWSVQRQ